MAPKTAYFGPRVQEIIVTLAEVLDARVDLYDAQQRYGAPDRRGLTRPSAFVQSPAGGCAVHERISDRWQLHIYRVGPGFLHPSARAMATWAARELAKLLPAGTSRSPSSPPPASGGGNASPAELGIPVSWLRRTRG
jgi:hypothetical protein